jgi:hypothetical protein
MILVASNSYAAVKTGISCSKVGIKSVSAGKTYTCVKSGKKLVWDNGVLVPVAKPAPTAGASATSFVPAVVYPKGPTSFDDLVENYQGISYSAWSKSSAQIKSSTSNFPAFKVVTGPNTKLIIEKPETIFTLINRLYPNFGSSKDFTVLTFSYEDRDWAQAQLKTMNTEDPSASTWVMDTGCVTRETCWGGNLFTDSKSRQVLVLTTTVADENHTSGALQAHEYTHAVQQNQMGFHIPWPPNDTYPPLWYHEGGAQFSEGVAIYNQSFEKYSAYRRHEAANIFRDSSVTSQWIQEFLGANPDLTWVRKYDNWTKFVMGAMFVEALVAIKGPESNMEVWKLAGTGMKFPQAFEKVYGISFEKALPIISKAIALELGRS